MNSISIELYQQCCANNEAAYQELSRYLLQSACFQLREYPDLIGEAEDCVQNSLLNIFQALQNNQGPRQPEYFRTWATKILTRRVIDLLRRRGRRPLRSLDDPLPANENGHEETIADRVADAKSPDPAESVTNAQGLLELIAQIRTHPLLTSNERAILLDGYLHDITSHELAERLGVKLSTVNVSRMRGREKLQKDEPLMAKVRELLLKSDDWQQFYVYFETFLSPAATEDS